MDENNFVVKTIFHAGGNSEVLTENYFATRKEADEFCALTDYAMKLNYGAEQQLVTTVIVELCPPPGAKHSRLTILVKTFIFKTCSALRKPPGAPSGSIYKGGSLWFHLPSASPGVLLPTGSRHPLWSPTSVP